MQNFDDSKLSKVKLVVWDLDETFWSGVLSEHTALFSNENAELVKNLTKRGVINAICSKNDEETVLNFLKDKNINEYFVFNSINWNPKGPRLKNLITNAQLRAENVLFIDDNEHNLGEALYFCPSLMTATPQIIKKLQQQVEYIGKEDPSLSRLKQYKILEIKLKEKTRFDDEKDFLKQSSITIRFCECLENINRIHELMLRSNQLNYTKKRRSIDELSQTIKDVAYDTKCIFAKDNYGDYGLIGFYALHKERNTLEDYFFSCRVLGMHIEQFVYQILNYPELETYGEVIVQLEEKSNIDYISIDNNFIPQNFEHNHIDILMRGPCDLESVAFYFGSDRVEKEFRYVNENGDLVSNGSHIAIIENILLGLTESKCKFTDSGVYNTKLFNKEIKLIVLSTLVNAMLGEYRRKDSNERAVFAEWKYDATDPNNMDDLMNQSIWNGYKTAKENDYVEFRDYYQYIGRINPEQMAIRYKAFVDAIPKSKKICFLLGPEIPAPNETCNSLIGAECFYRRFNETMKCIFKENQNVQFVDITTLLDGEDGFTNSITHFTRKVYYKIAQDIRRQNPELFSKKQEKFIISEIKHKTTVLMKKIGFHK